MSNSAKMTYYFNNGDDSVHTKHVLFMTDNKGDNAFQSDSQIVQDEINIHCGVKRCPEREML